MEISYWHLFIFLTKLLGVLSNSTEIKITSRNVPDVEFTTRKIAINIMKLNPDIKLPTINTSLLKSPEIGNSSSLLHHWRKHIHHSKRHRKPLENLRKHHITSLSSQKNNLSFVLPMNWKRNRSVSPPSMNDPQQVFANLIHRIISINDNLNFLSTHSPPDNISQTNNAKNIYYDANNTIINFVANHTTNNSGLITPKFYNESHTGCNMTESLDNQSCNKDHLLNFSINKTSELLKANSTTPSSLVDHLKILTKSPNKSTAFEFNQPLTGDSFMRIFQKKPLLPVSENNYATTKSNFIIIDDLGFFGDPSDETPIIKPREVFHPRPSFIDYIFGENIDNPAPRIENRMKYVDFWNLETDKNKTIDPGMIKIKFKLRSDDINDQHLPLWKSDNNIFSSKVSEPQYNSRINNKREEIKVQDRFIPFRSIKQPKSKVLNESDFQSAFLSTFYITIAICGIFFAIAVWWRRFSVIKKSNFTSISDAIHLSPTPSSPLAARRPRHSRV
ncbi:GSCOCG00008132001-RA-CDS [Cotesia congregata]|nr:GSCOCG00008132001-RA-CDS [Cotesia congregata]